MIFFFDRLATSFHSLYCIVSVARESFMQTNFFEKANELFCFHNFHSDLISLGNY